MKILSFFCLVCLIMPKVEKGSALALTRRVINGEQASRGDVKCLASLWFLKRSRYTANPSIKHVCGGILIHQQWVLTSAGCFSTRVMTGADRQEDWRVKLGVFKQTENDANVQEFNICGMFDVRVKHTAKDNLVLLKLDHPIKVTSYVAPCSALGENDCARENTSCKAMGWGMTEPALTQKWGPVDVPHKVDLKVTSDAACRRTYGQHLASTDFCAIGQRLQNTQSTRVGDLGLGDEGAPLFCTCADGVKRLTGMFSAGRYLGNQAQPAKFTRLSTFKTFINDTINAN